MYDLDESIVKQVLSLNTKIFADGANFENMINLNNQSYIQGLTTNPTLMKKSGITDYEKFAKEVLEKIQEKSISFEVFSDDHEEMYDQAKKITKWGDNVYVKIPVTNSKNISSYELIKKLSNEGIKLNVTAIFTNEQVVNTFQSLDKNISSYISIFAGRIADTGIDPLPIMDSAVKLVDKSKIEIIWASPRELFNVIQCSNIGCHIITATPDIIAKLKLLNKNLDNFSLETVKMFNEDALQAGYKI